MRSAPPAAASAASQASATLPACAAGASSCAATRAASAAPLLPRDAVRRGKPPAVDAAAQLCGDRTRASLSARMPQTASVRPATGSARKLRASTRAASGLWATSSIQAGGSRAPAPTAGSDLPAAPARQSPAPPPRPAHGCAARAPRGGNGRGRIVILGIPAERRRRQILEAPDAAAVAPAGRRAGGHRNSTPRRLTPAPIAAREVA